ncbi:MAG TPA: DUF6152 family protein [Bryobacteraceae bacterium]|jgi:hypothetical protein|nr:DUF6152 family protein [Bryobacteraceae bacterium]
MRKAIRIKLLLIAGIGLLTVVAPVWAHHALAATYDTRQSIVLAGTVMKISWENPHVHLYLQADDKTSPAWEFELGSPNMQIQNGWKLDTFRRGDHVVVTAYPARNGSRFGYASKVALSSR